MGVVCGVLGSGKWMLQSVMERLREDLGLLETVAMNSLNICIYRIDIATIEQYVSD